MRRLFASISSVTVPTNPSLRLPKLSSLTTTTTITQPTIRCFPNSLQHRLCNHDQTNSISSPRFSTSTAWTSIVGAYHQALNFSASWSKWTRQVQPRSCTHVVATATTIPKFFSSTSTTTSIENASKQQQRQQQPAEIGAQEQQGEERQEKQELSRKPQLRRFRSAYNARIRTIILIKENMPATGKRPKAFQVNIREWTNNIPGILQHETPIYKMQARPTSLEGFREMMTMNEDGVRMRNRKWLYPFRMVMAISKQQVRSAVRRRIIMKKLRKALRRSFYKHVVPGYDFLISMKKEADFAKISQMRQHLVETLKALDLHMPQGNQHLVEGPALAFINDKYKRIIIPKKIHKMEKHYQYQYHYDPEVDKDTVDAAVKQYIADERARLERRLIERTQQEVLDNILTAAEINQVLDPAAVFTPFVRPISSSSSSIISLSSSSSSGGGGEGEEEEEECSDQAATAQEESSVAQ